MSYLQKFEGNLRGIFQQNHMPREWLRPKRQKKIMNPDPILLSFSIKPKDMNENLRLPTERAPRIQHTQMLKPRPQGQALKKNTPSKMIHLGFCNSKPNNKKFVSPWFLRRLQTPSLVENGDHRQMRNQIVITHFGFVVAKMSRRIPLLVLPTGLDRLYAKLMKHIQRQN